MPPLVGPVIDPLRKLGNGISNVTGWSVFSGPLGWLLTGLLLLSVVMIVVALALGRRRANDRLAGAAR